MHFKISFLYQLQRSNLHKFNKHLLQKKTFEIFFKSVGTRALIPRYNNCAHAYVSVLSLQVAREENNFWYFVTLCYKYIPEF